MTGAQTATVLEMLQRIQADRAEIRNALEMLFWRVARIEDRLDTLDQRLMMLQYGPPRARDRHGRGRALSDAKRA